MIFGNIKIKTKKKQPIIVAQLEAVKTSRLFKAQTGLKF